MSVQTLLEQIFATPQDVLAETPGKLVTSDVLGPMLGEAVPAPVIAAAVEEYFDGAGAIAIAQGGTGATTKAAARAALEVQAASANLTEFAAVNPTPFGLNLTTQADADDVREELGLGGAATRDVGQAPGSVAAGDDDRLVNALLATDPEGARLALGLSAAATADFGTDAGKVVQGNDARLVAAAAVTGWAISPKSFGAVGDGDADDTQSLKDAIAEAIARKALIGVAPPVFLPAGRYKITDTGLLNSNVGGLTICGDPAGGTEIIHTAINKPLIQMQGSRGTIASGKPLTAAADAGTRAISVASTADLSVGQYVIIQDPSQPVLSVQDGSTQCDLGEFGRIKLIDSGTQVTLEGRLEFSYTTSAKLRPCALVDGFTARDLTITYDTPDVFPGDFNTALSLFNVSRADIRNVTFKNLGQDAIRADCIVDSVIRNCWFLDFNNQLNGTPYGVNISNGASRVQVQGCFMRGGRHLVTGGTGVDQIESSDIDVSDCMTVGSSGAGFDTHEGTRNWTFKDCSTIGTGLQEGIGTGNHGGLQIRGRGHEIIDHKTTGCTYGLIVVYADGVKVEGLEASGCKYGTYIAKSSNTEVRGARLHNCITNGVFIDRQSANMPNLVLDDIKVYGPTSGAAYASTSGQWEDSWEVKDLRADDASVFTDFIPHQAIYGAKALDGVKAMSVGERENILFGGGETTLVSGQMLMAAVHINKGELLTKLFVAFSSSTDLTHRFLALYTKGLTLLGQTADAGAAVPPNAWTANDLQAPVRAPYTGLYYVGVCVVGTAGAVRGALSWSGSLNPSPRLAGQSSTGLTATAPSTAAALSSVDKLPWVGVG